MSNDSIPIDRSVREERVIERFLEAQNEVSFADAFRIFTPQLLAFFRARGCAPAVAEDLAQTLKCELMARLRAVLGRNNAKDAPQPVVIRIGNLKLDPERRLFWRGDEEIHLSPKEFDLLAFMMKNAGVTLTHVKLLRSVWGIEYGGELEYLRTYVCMNGKRSKRFQPSPNIL